MHFMPRPLRILAVAAVAAGVGYWLFADTVRFYAVDADPARPLRVSFWGTYEEYAVWQKILADFRRETGIEAKAEYVPARYDDKVRQQMIGRTAADVIVWQDEPFPRDVKSRVFEDLTDHFRADPEFAPRIRAAGGDLYAALHSVYADTMVESFGVWPDPARRSDWRQYGMPVWGGCNLLYWDRAAFRRANIEVVSDPSPGGPAGLTKEPSGRWVVNDERWTVPEWVEVCRRLTVDEDGDGRPDRFGFFLPNHVYFLPWEQTMGAYLLDEPYGTHTTMYGPKWEAALQLYQDLRFRYGVCPSQAQAGPMGQNVGFLAGRVAMFGSGPWDMALCNAGGADYDLAHIPRDPQTGRRSTRITSDAAFVFRHSKRKDDAWRLVRYLGSTPAQVEFCRMQRCPSRRDAVGAFVAQNLSLHAGKFVDASGGRPGYAGYAEVQPISDNYVLMERVWRATNELLVDADPAERLTPAEAIGRFYAGRAGNDRNSQALLDALPPADPAAVEPYRRAYLRRERK